MNELEKLKHYAKSVGYEFYWHDEEDKDKLTLVGTEPHDVIEGKEYGFEVLYEGRCQSICPDRYAVIEYFELMEELKSL